VEKNQSKRTFKTVHGRQKVTLNKKEFSSFASKQNEVGNRTRGTSAFDGAIREAIRWVKRFFGFGGSRKVLPVAIIKKSNKEMKCRTAEVRRERNISRESRKVNGHRGARKGK